MHQLEDFLNSLNKIEKLNNNDDETTTKLIYAEKLNDFFLNNDLCWRFLNGLYKKTYKVSTNFNNILDNFKKKKNFFTLKDKPNSIFKFCLRFNGQMLHASPTKPTN